MNRWVARVLVFAWSLLLAAGCRDDRGSLKSGVFEPARDAPDFVLRGSDGSDVSLARFRGKVVVLEFGFTHCATVCPVSLGKLSQAFRELGPAGRDVQVIFVTVDPARDTTARLHEYLAHFGPSFLGVTGKSLDPDAQTAELKGVRDAYGVIAEEARGDSPGYQIHHSASLLLIDGTGKLRALVPFGTPVDVIVHDLRLLVGKS